MILRVREAGPRQGLARARNSCSAGRLRELVFEPSQKKFPYEQGDFFSPLFYL